MVATGTKVLLSDLYIPGISGLIPGATEGVDNDDRGPQLDNSNGVFGGWRAEASVAGGVPGGVFNLVTGSILLKVQIRDPNNTDDTANDGFFALLADINNNFVTCSLGGGDSGFFNGSLVTGFGANIQTNTAGNFGSGVVDWEQIKIFELYGLPTKNNRVRFFGGGSAYVSNDVILTGPFSEYVDFTVEGSVQTLARSVLLATSLQIGDGGTTPVNQDFSRYAIAAFSPVDKPRDQYHWYGDTVGREIQINLGATDNLILSNSSINGGGADLTIIDASSSVFSPITITSIGTAKLGSKSYSDRFIDIDTVEAEQSSHDGSQFQGCGTLNVSADNTFTDNSGATVFTLGLNTGNGVVFSGAPGVYDFRIRFSNNSGVADLSITPTSAGNFEFPGISAADAYELKIHNNSTTEAIVVVIPGSISSFSTSTAGGAIQVIKPSLTITYTGIPSGGIFSIYDDNDPDPQDLGDLLQETNPTTGADISYQGATGNAVVLQFLGPGFKELNLSTTIPTSSQTVDLSEFIEIEDNL